MSNHTHPYSIWVPDGAFKELWTFDGSVFGAVQTCPQGHASCQFKDTCEWKTFAIRDATKGSYVTQAAAYGVGHTHNLTVIEAVSFTPTNTNIYLRLANTCASGHPNCAALEACSSPDGYALTVREVVGVTTGPEGDPDGVHFHYLQSLRDIILSYARHISAVYDCPLGHERCQVTVTYENVNLFRNGLYTTATGDDQAPAVSGGTGGLARSLMKEAFL